MRRFYGHCRNILRKVFAPFGIPGSNDHAVTGYLERHRTRTVWFYRDYVRLTGGHLKHSHYFGHVQRMPGFARRITFRTEPSDESQARERGRLWPAGDGVLAERWEPARGDLLFLAGLDWRYLNRIESGGLANPIINLVQGVRHAHEGTELYGYLSERAIRICVSQEVADAVRATGRTNGPVLTIPNGLDVKPFDLAGMDSPAGFDERRKPITIVGYKRPELARRLSERLDAAHIEHLLVSEFVDRSQFLELLRGSRVAVCLPREREGFYLPALEAMAAGCLVVTLDCVGNRGFCRHQANCLIAGHTPDSLFRETTKALAMSDSDRHGMHRRGRDTAAEHSLELERQRFHAILGDIDRLWSASKADASPTSWRSIMPALPARYRPRLDFMIVGGQKCGTTALAHFLSQHPEIGMASPKEVHLFDAPNYSPEWTPEQIDKRYGSNLAHCAGARIMGEATPSYMFVPEIGQDLKRYNPDLKLIVLLRDPVERAISHYYMETGRGRERRPLWLALLREPFRLRRCRNGRVRGSETQRCSYRTRGLYSLQLLNIFRYFDREQVLVVDSHDLSQRHDEVLGRVFAFLGVSENACIEPEIVFKGERGGRKHRIVSWMLKLTYLAEFVRLRAVLREQA